MAEFCPFCHKEMTQEHMITFIDYNCQTNDHYYSSRYINNILTKIKLYLKDENGMKNYLKIHFDDDYSEVWIKNSSVKRNRINNLFIPNFSDKIALLKKIKTLLAFS